MKLLKRSAVIILALTLMLSALTGCGLLGKFIKGDESEGGRQTNEDGVFLLEEPVVVADGSESYFKVVRPNVNNDVYASCVSALRKPADGFTLNGDVAKEEKNSNTDGEILIGNTCRTQTKTEMDKIGFDGFSITYVENKIVVAAHDPERLVEAVTFLKEKLLRVNEGRLEYIGDYTYESDTPLMIGEGDSIADYKIVCGHDDLYGAAYSIQQYINNKHGVTLPIIFDKTEKTGKEIVLGKTNREISKLADSLSVSEGIVVVQNKDMLIATKDILDTDTLFDIFEEEFLSGTYTDHFNFKADYSETINIYSGIFRDPAAFTKGSDIRIMSFNILVDIWSTSPSISGRRETVAQVIKYYAPDVVGLQEASKSWHSALKADLKNTSYELINTERHEAVTTKYGKTNFCPILYNTDTLTLIECDTREFVVKDNAYLRILSYAYFEHKDSGKRFVVISTHYADPGSDAAEKEENVIIRTAQTEEMIALIDELEAKYDCAVLLTGDFNTTEGSDKTGRHAPYWNLINSGLSDAKNTADKINRACSTWHELGQSADISSVGSFDHIFGNDKVKFTYFNTLIDKAIINAADHCPIYADVIFK